MCRFSDGIITIVIISPLKIYVCCMYMCPNSSIKKIEKKIAVNAIFRTTTYTHSQIFHYSMSVIWMKGLPSEFPICFTLAVTFYLVPGWGATVVSACFGNYARRRRHQRGKAHSYRRCSELSLR